MDSSLSAEIIGSNEDLITQILLRLPVKPLLRFKSVSKQWLSLISTPHFSSLHTLRNPNHTISALFLRNSPLEFKFLSLSSSSSSSSSSASPLSFDLFHGIKILQSCNGLLLCSTLPKIGQKRNYYISNPTTKQMFTLPSLVGDANAASPTTLFGLNLAFDPLKSCNYKVICVRSTTNSIYQYQIETYQSEIAAWRLSGLPFVAPFDMVFDNGVFWNGAIHWISATGNAIYFDMDRECISSMPKLPFSYEWGKRRFRYFGESDGHLHLIEIYGLRTTQFNVYEMEKDYSFWRIRYRVQLDHVVAAFPEMVRSYLDAGDSNYYAFVVLSLVEEDATEESSLLLHIPGKVISYNLKNKTFKKVCELSYGTGGSRTKESLQFGWLDAYQYIETLACV
ncbi:F-box protein At5g07610 [Ricinus communis]|uniref:Uncharacterized protein n=1 Tax=Ricinus communis TaxID=3988 RepID=B9SJS1_RICCO|nr:F-box protein At5g07610 [Ricinus communis]EEF36137.1 conserved hypothetical protein [Ricinus communis]|eukprot:XP_002526240.1 F-box protein At5g07610 [Ricinus communis]